VNDAIVKQSSITVWTMELSQIVETLWIPFCNLLNAAERTRSASFAFERHRREYQAAHVLKRLMLSAAVVNDTPPKAWVFETSERGKPSVLHGMGPYFNLSHCDGLVACAVSWDFKLGIDVESLSHAPSLELLDVSFAPSERAWLRSLPAERRGLRSLELWTLREAYLKATGLGLGEPTDSFAFRFDPRRITFGHPTKGEADAWHFEQHRIGSRYVLALAWRADSADTLVDLVTVRPRYLVDEDVILIERH
jgi:4'-phosphopantetheinyl transferase